MRLHLNEAFWLSCEASCFRELLLSQLGKKWWRGDTNNPVHRWEPPPTVAYTGICIYLGFMGHLMRKEAIIVKF